ncbi:MAG TPA: secretin N-terminal domain-containing protein, partial [Acidiferrobacteraceae bacterium]|nr:secretin N-terminal domain-containing protein [Acidiferrobacteraceae bacterium]
MRTGTRRWSAVLALALGGCASTGWHTEAGRHIDHTLTVAQHQPLPGPSAQVKAALVPGIQIHLPALGPRTGGTRFNFAVNNAPARSVFLGLVAGTGYSVTVPPGIAGRITLNLHQVTVPEAMRAIRRTYDYEYERRGHQYYLLPPGLQTRIFRVNYLDVVRTGSSDTRMASGDITSNGASGAGGLPGSAAGSMPQATSGNSSLSNIQVETKSKSDFWKQLQQTVSALVGTQNGSMVVANAQASLLIVRAPAQQMRVVSKLLRMMQANVDREVVLSAKILEVQLNSGFQSGINWADLARLNGASITSEQLGGGTLLGSGTSEIGGASESLSPSGVFPYQPVTIAPTSAFGGMLTLAVQARNFASFIELL